MPTGRLVGQTVLDHQTNGQGDDAVRVVCPRQGQVRHIGVKVFVALGAMMDRIREVHVVWTTGAQIPPIMQNPPCPAIPIRTVPTGRARLSSEVLGSLVFFFFCFIFCEFPGAGVRAGSRRRQAWDGRKLAERVSSPARGMSLPSRVCTHCYL